MATKDVQTTDLVETIAKAVVTANKAIEGEVITSTIKTMTEDEYREYSKKNGRVMGRAEGVKTKISMEEYGVLMKEPSWSEKDIMEKHGLTNEDMDAIKAKFKNSQRGK